MIHAIQRIWQRYVHHIILGIIIICATILRWPMVYFALPYTPQPDEPYVINMLFDMFRFHSWIPNNFERPHLSVYVTFVGVWLGQLFVPIDPAVLGRATDRITMASAPFMHGRITMIIVGLASILAAYWHARQYQLGWAALVAAGWLALLPFHQEQSGIITPDIMVGLFTFLVMGSCWQYSLTPTTRQLWIVALMCGLATGTKYNLAAAILIPALMQWPLITQRLWRQLIQNGAIIVAGTIIGFLITTPGIFWSINEIRANLDAQISHYSRPDVVFKPWDWEYYLWFFQHEGWLLTGSITAIIGMWVVLRQKRLVDIGMVIFLLVQLLFFLSRERHYMRNLMPMVVYGAIYIAHGTNWGVEYLRRWITPLSLRIILVVGIVGSQLLIEGISHYQFMQRPYNLLTIDHITDRQPRGAVKICTYEPITVAQTPSCDAIVNNTGDIAIWQQSGMQQLVINRSKFATLVVPNTLTLLQAIPNSTAGGNGQAFDFYTQNPIQSLTTAGQSASTSDGIEIIGVRLGSGSVRNRLSPLSTNTQLPLRGNVLNMNLYLQVNVPVSEPNWWLFVHLIDANGTKITERANPPRPDYPIAEWKAGELVFVNADLQTPPLPAGEYTIVVGFFRPSDGARMIISGSDNGTWQLPITIKNP
jgi:hypothetical protein